MKEMNKMNAKDIVDFNSKSALSKAVSIDDNVGELLRYIQISDVLCNDVYNFFEEYSSENDPQYTVQEKYCLILEAIQRYYVYTEILLDCIIEMKRLIEQTDCKISSLCDDIRNNDNNTNEAVNLTSRESGGKIGKNTISQRLCEIQETIRFAIGFVHKTNDVSDLVQKCAENNTDECIKSVCWLDKCANELLPELEQAYTTTDFLLSAVKDSDTTNDND